MVKCRDAIIIAVGTSAREYDEKIVKLVVQQMKEGKLDLNEDEDPKLAKEQKKKKEAEKKLSDKKLLGKLNDDVVFLEKILKSQACKNSKNVQGNRQQTKVSTMATEALEYLEKRKSFWQQTAVANK